MKIAILTQFPNVHENKRLLEAALKLGHDAEIINIHEVVIDVGGKNADQKGIFYSGKNLQDYDIVIIRSVFSVLKRALAIVRYLRNKGVKVMDNNLDKVAYSINKVKDYVLFDVADLPIPRTINTSNEEDFIENCNELGFPVIVKHSGSGQGLGVYKLDDVNEVEDFVDKLKESGKKFKTYLIQEFIPYVQDLRIVVISGEVVGSMQRIPAEGSFKANFSQGGTVKKIDIDDETRDLAKKAALSTEAFNAGVDVLITADGSKYILEVNRTPGFEGFEQATGLDIATLTIEEAIKHAY